MIALTGTLQVAQRAMSRSPYVECYVDNRPVEMPRFEWSQVYDDGSADCCNAAVVAFDGSIVRARALPGSPTLLQVQRVTDPSVVGQWTSWATLVSGISTGEQTVALAADDVSGTVRLFYISSTLKILYCRVSGDNGATWGAAQVVYDLTGFVHEMRGVASDGRCSETRVVWGFDPMGADPDDYLCVSRYDSQYGWLTVVDTDVRYSSIKHLGVCREDDGTMDILVAWGNPLQIGLRKYVVGSGFSGSFSMLTPGSGSGFTFGYPWARAPRADEPRLFYLYSESYSGIGANQVVRLVSTKTRDWLANEVPVDIGGLKGSALLKRLGYWYLVCSRRALRAPAYVVGGDRVDVSADVKSVEVEERAGRGGRAVVVLDNADGAYEDAGESGTYKWIREGSQVALKLGYETAVGNEGVWASPWWIEGVFFEDERGEGSVVLECVDAWGWLERLRSPRQVTFSNQTLNYILLRVLWSVCGVADGVLHPNLNVTVPTFTWMPGESLASVARRVLGMAGLWLRFKTVQSSNGAGWDSVGVEVVALGTGGSSYSYGPGAHPVLRGRYGKRALRPNDFAVEGLTHGAFQVDYNGIRDVGRRLFQREVDRHLDTQAKVDALADYLDYAADVGAHRGFLEAGVNVGQQVGDVVDVSDARANLAGATRRVGEIVIDLDRRRGRFRQRIELVGV